MRGSNRPPLHTQLPIGMGLYEWMIDDRENLPSYVTDGRLPPPSSMFIGIGLGIALTVLRLLLNLFVFKPMARKMLGLDNIREPRPIGSLKLDSSPTKIIPKVELEKISKASGIPVEEVQAYASARRVAALRNKQIYKFTEALWRFLVYSFLVVLGVLVVKDRVWFADPFRAWDDWPPRDNGEMLEWYYHIALSVYWHFIVFQIVDTKRSDFWQMFVHHVATLFLLSFSWLLNLDRIGSLIMLCHDISDPFLEAAKLFNYLQKKHHWCHVFADGLFFIFAGVFIYSRLYLYPRYMVLNVAYAALPSEFCRMFFTSLLVTLLVLHVFWAYLILRMIYMFVVYGTEEDIRSDDEEQLEGEGNTGELSGAGGGDKGVKKENGGACKIAGGVVNGNGGGGGDSNHKEANGCVSTSSVVTDKKNV